MTTYTLVIEHAATGLREAKAYSTAANAIDDMENWLRGRVAIAAILRDGQPISEATLRSEEAVSPIDAEPLRVNRLDRIRLDLKEPCRAATAL